MIHESCAHDLRRAGWAYLRGCIAGDPEALESLWQQYGPEHLVLALSAAGQDLLAEMRGNPHGEGCDCGTLQWIDEALTNLAEMEL